MRWPLVWRSSRQTELDIAAKVAADAQADAAFWKAQANTASGLVLAGAQREATASEQAQRREAILEARSRDWERLFFELLDRKDGIDLRPRPERTADPKPADEMRELIHARAGSNYRMRNMMLSQLAVDRAEGKDSDTIREAILSGVPSDGVPA